MKTQARYIPWKQKFSSTAKEDIYLTKEFLFLLGNWAVKQKIIKRY